jgi:hypothetical protein
VVRNWSVDGYRWTLTVAVPDGQPQIWLGAFPLIRRLGWALIWAFAVTAKT